jgi:hypothetical protein
VQVKPDKYHIIGTFPDLDAGGKNNENFISHLFKVE